MDRSLAALQQTYADWQWIQFYGMPSLDNVVAYCTHCLPPEERAADSINQRIARQGVAGDRAAKGVEFRAEELQPDLFLVRKILRTRPLAQRRGGEEAQAVFYVLRGVVYKSPTLMHVAFARLNLASAALELAVRNEGHDSNYSSAHGVPLMGHMSVIPTDFESMAVAERKRVRDAQQLAARASDADVGAAHADGGHLRDRASAGEEAARLPSTHRKAVQRVMQRVGQDFFPGAQSASETRSIGSVSSAGGSMAR